MSTLPKLHPEGVLTVAQGAIYDLARRMPDYLEASPTKAASVAKCLGLDVKIEDGSIYIGNPVNDVYAYLDGREHNWNSLPEAFKGLLKKAMQGEADADIPLDIELRGLDNGCVGVASSAMRCEFPVTKDQLGTRLSELCREWADLNLAEGDAQIVKIVREIRDPDALLAPVQVACPACGAPRKASFSL